MNDSDYARMVEQETLIVEATELLGTLMRREGLNGKELAQRLGKSKGHVSQLLNGERNMTLRTLADIAFALGYRIELRATAPRPPVIRPLEGIAIGAVPVVGKREDEG